MTTDLRRIRLHSGEIGLSLEPLLGRLQLGTEYAVLAAATHPTDTSRVFVLLHRDPGTEYPDPTPYVVYRVDPRDGSCHGGQYLSSVNTAFLRFAERMAILGLDGEPSFPGTPTPLPPVRMSASQAGVHSRTNPGRHSGWDGEDEYVYQNGKLVDVFMVDKAVQAALESGAQATQDSADQSGEGYTIGQSYDELPAHTAQSEFYADNTQSGEH